MNGFLKGVLDRIKRNTKIIKILRKKIYYSYKILKCTRDIMSYPAFLSFLNV